MIFISTDEYVHVLNTYGGIPSMFYTILSIEDFNTYLRNIEGNINIADNLWVLTGGITNYFEKDRYRFERYEILMNAEHNRRLISSDYLKEEFDRIIDVILQDDEIPTYEEDIDYLHTVRSIL